MLRRALLTLLFSSALALSARDAAAAPVLRFSTTAPGTVVGIGNTLGLSKGLNENGPGTRDSIGTFTTLLALADDVPLNAANPWPLGTTYDWTKNGSTAALSLPSEGTVLYAELVWGGSYNYTDDVTAFLQTPVLLSGGNAQVSVMPDGATAMTLAQIAMQGFAVNYYMRSADVTAFVKAAGPGVYSVQGVPATQTTTINSLNAAGWTLAVVVRDPSSQIRNLSVFVGGSFVDENSQQDYTVSGFCTPPAGVVNGSAIVSTIEGDANLVGDQLLIAPTGAGPFVQLSGPNNPANNFFCSQINGPAGLLDALGTFGAVNHDALAGINVAGGRQGWDVTTVPLSSQDGQLQNGQTSAVLRTITTGDSYVPIVAAFAIDVNAPDFTAGGSKLTTSATHVTTGDDLTVTLDLSNTGQVVAESVKLTMPLDPGLSLASFKMDGQVGDINGNPVSAAGLTAGVDAGDLGPGQVRHVVIDLVVTGPPAGSNFLFESTWSYGYQVCAGGATLPETFGQLGVVAFDVPTTSASSSASASSGSAGGAGGSASASSGGGDASSGGAGGSGGGSESSVDTGGCGCAVPGGEGAPWGHAALVIAAAGAIARRRRVTARAARPSGEP